MLVDPLVLIEALVFGRHKGLLHVFGYVGEDHPDAALVLLEDLREAVALAVEHDARPRQFQALEPVVIRQVGGCLVVDGDHLGKIDGRAWDRLLLAELPVGGLQVREIDAAKRLGFTDGLRVIERRDQELIEVDVLEIEDLKHLAAAAVQKLGHHCLIAILVKFGFHGVGCRRDLAQCQTGREDLDEN